jgi:hypothetical protein
MRRDFTCSREQKLPSVALMLSEGDLFHVSRLGIEGLLTGGLNRLDACFFLEKPSHLAWLRVPTQTFLAENKFAVYSDFKTPLAGGNEGQLFDYRRELLK